MRRTRIKICGITRPIDAIAAAEAGADGIGVFLHGKSKRWITIKQAKVIVRALPPLVTAVGLFVDAEEKFIREAVAMLGLSAVQLHGDETPELVAKLAPIPVIKAIGVDTNLLAELRRWKKSPLRGILLDNPGGGGKGIENDWSAIASIQWNGFAPMIVAGGLNAKNVGPVVRRLRPAAVDVCSGVESAPGEKSKSMLRRFVTAVRHADGG